MRRPHWIRIKSQCNDSIDLNLYVPKGLSTEQLENVKVEFTRLMDEYEKEHGDFHDFDSYRNLVTTMVNLNIEWECVRVDQTIYI